MVVGGERVKSVTAFRRRAPDIKWTSAGWRAAPRVTHPANSCGGAFLPRPESMMNTRSIQCNAGFAHSALPVSRRLGAAVSAALAVPRLWARRGHDNRALLRLDDHLLRDIGLDRARVEEMAGHPFWRA
jgi:uncharacterized protein YjiS (DUF1127 family)